MGFFEAALPVAHKIFNNIIVAAIMLLAGLIAGKLVGRFLHRFLSEIELNKTISNSTKISMPADEIISLFVMYIIYFFSIIIAIDIMNLEGILFNALAAAIVIIVLMSIAFSLADFIPNIFGGVFLHQKGIIHKGDIIRANGMEGKIISIDLVDTKLKTKAGDLIFVPNSFLAKNLILVKKKKSA